MAIVATELRKGMAIKWKGDVCLVLETHHRTPGNKRGFIQGILRSLNTGRSLDERFGSDVKIETVSVSREPWEFNYKDQTGYTFLNPQTFENLTLDAALVGDSKLYLTENLVCNIVFVESKAVQVEVPASVVLKVTESPEGVRGDSSSNVMKPATLETGLTLQVPLFIKEGDLIKVSTQDGKYVSRA